MGARAFIAGIAGTVLTDRERASALAELEAKAVGEG